MKFETPKEVFVKGLLWQKLDDQMPEGFSPGFTLPDAFELNMSEAYRQRDGASETIGWEFEATMRQNMDLSRFPFDHDSVSIRLLPKDFTRNVVLVPDLASYSVINPSSLPGLDENLELSGWHLSRSFFDYKISTYKTNFGLSGSSAQTQLPELHFNISVQRNLVDAAVSYGIPLLVVGVT